MNFKDFKYERPVYIKVKSDIDDLILQLQNAVSFEEVKDIIKEIYVIKKNIEAASNISNIMYTINTNDEFYSKGNEYWDGYGPLYEELNVSLYKALLESKYKSEIGNCYGEQILNIAEYSLRSFSKYII